MENQSGSLLSRPRFGSDTLVASSLRREGRILSQNISWSINSLRIRYHHHPSGPGTCITTRNDAESPYLSSRLLCLESLDLWLHLKMKREANARDSDRSWETLSNPADLLMEKKIWRKLDLHILPVVATFYFLSFLVSRSVRFESLLWA
jgi:hypothetical protein